MSFKNYILSFFGNKSEEIIEVNVDNKISINNASEYLDTLITKLFTFSHLISIEDGQKKIFRFQNKKTKGAYEILDDKFIMHLVFINRNKTYRVKIIYFFGKNFKLYINSEDFTHLLSEQLTTIAFFKLNSCDNLFKDSSKMNSLKLRLSKK